MPIEAAGGSAYSDQATTAQLVRLVGDHPKRGERAAIVDKSGDQVKMHGDPSTEMQRATG
jgi:hypothetical protein